MDQRQTPGPPAKQKRRSFLRERAEVYALDEPFVQDVLGRFDTDKAPFVILARRWVSKACQVAPEKITGDLSLSTIRELLPAQSTSWALRWVQHKLTRMLAYDVRSYLGRFANRRSASIEETVRQLLGVAPVSEMSPSIGQFLIAHACRLRNEHAFLGAQPQAQSDLLTSARREGLGTALADLFRCAYQVFDDSVGSDKFIAERQHVYVTDSAFLRESLGGASIGQKRIAVILRRIVAEECLVAPERISSSETLDALAKIATRFKGDRYDEFDWHLSILTGSLPAVALNKLSSVTEPLVKLSWKSELQIAEWIRQASYEILELLQEAGYRVA